MAFVETPRFPETMSYNSSGGPQWSTHVVTLQGGAEKRNALWTYPRHLYNARYAVQKADDMETIFQWFYSMKGRFNGFRFKDWHDFTSATSNGTPTDTDQTLGTGDGADDTFQLIKNYTIGTETLARIISKPVSGTVVCSLDDVPEAGFTVDTTTGIVTFSSPPGGGVVVKAGYEFDVPVRFDIDHLPVTFDDWEIRSADIPIVELRL